MANTESDSVLEELRTIKKLLMFGFLKQGVTQEQLSVVLGVSQSSISRMLPTGTKLEKK